MSQATQYCPRCGSEKTASRRQLFYTLMCGVQPQGAFNWYGGDEPQAMPPKSLFLTFFLAMVALAIPATSFWLLEQFPAVTILVSIGILLAGFLLVDVLLTYSRYKIWGEQWLCGQCRGVFAPKAEQNSN